MTAMRVFVQADGLRPLLDEPTIVRRVQLKQSRFASKVEVLDQIGYRGARGRREHHRCSRMTLAAVERCGQLLDVDGYLGANVAPERGNRRLQTFFSNEDYTAYRAMIADSCRAAGVAVLAYCLMPNHVHLVLVPSDADGKRAALAEAHRRYAALINRRKGWRGHLWQERFHSTTRT
jgi:hypothetical protein